MIGIFYIEYCTACVVVGVKQTPRIRRRQRLSFANKNVVIEAPNVKMIY